MCLGTALVGPACRSRREIAVPDPAAPTATAAPTTAATVRRLSRPVLRDLAVDPDDAIDHAVQRKALPHHLPPPLSHTACRVPIAQEVTHRGRQCPAVRRRHESTAGSIYDGVWHQSHRGG